MKIFLRESKFDNRISSQSVQFYKESSRNAYRVRRPYFYKKKNENVESLILQGRSYKNVTFFKGAQSSQKLCEYGRKQ